MAARIKEVWIGIEDPDPTVDRKGIRHLQDNGVKVRLFDADFQQQIREVNGEFLEHALARAAASADETAAATEHLSELESPLNALSVRDLSTTALERYRHIARIDEGEGAFLQRLLRLGVLCEEAGQLVPSGFGYVLFGTEPRTAVPQAGVLSTIHLTDGREELHDFDGPQVFVPGELLDWLRTRLPDPVSRTQAERTHMLDPLLAMVREAVVNAIIHRDYGIAGAKCQVVVGPDSVKIMSPGLPVEPISLQQMQALDAPMLSRNPLLHYVFSQMRLAEERGLGLKSLRLQAGQAQLPLPRYAWQTPYLTLTIYRSAEGLAHELVGPDAMAELSAAAAESWRVAALRDSISTRELMASTGFDERKAQRAVRSLLDAGLLRTLGNGRSTRYTVA